MARRDSRDALAELADGSDQPRPDRDDGDRRHDDGPRRPRHARRRRARRQPLFRAADLRPRPDERDLADDGGRARPQAPFGARHPPHRAAGAVDRRAGLHPDLADPVEHRGDPGRPWGRSRRWRARPASMCTGCNGRCCRSTATSCCARSWRRCERPRWALVDRGHRRRLQRARQLVPDLRQSRLSADGHCRFGPRHHAVERPDVRRAGGGRFARPGIPPLSSVRPLLARRLAALPRL